MDLEKIAKLADLTLTEEEKNIIGPQLTDVVKFFDQLNEVNTDDITPTSQTTGLTDITRADEVNVTRTLKSEEALFNAKQENNNYFVVDAVIDYENS